jgi:hypothetical protein
MAKGKVSEKHTMTKMDATRLGKNYGYMIRTLHCIPVEQYEAAGKAVSLNITVTTMTIVALGVQGRGSLRQSINRKQGTTGTSVTPPTSFSTRSYWKRLNASLH